MSWKQKAKRKARIARKRERLAHPERWLARMADVLKGLYPQARVFEIAYHGPRILGGKFKRRYNPANRARMYGPHPLMVLLGMEDR